MAKLGIISRDNGWGLTKDVKLMTQLWQQLGHSVTFIDYETKPNVQKQDIIFHNELVDGYYWRKARHNVLIPNQEWFLEGWLNTSRRFAGVWCKTQLAKTIFSNKGFRNIRFLGFTTESKHLNIPFDEKRYGFVHVAGNSRFKGTIPIIEAWRQHPNWPTLYLFNAFQDLSEKVKGIENIKYHFGFQPEPELNQLRNETLFHIQPSEAEGFGHVVWEVLSMGNILITTGAPPMNEIPKGVAYFINHNGQPKPYHLGTRYFVTPETIANTVRFVLNDKQNWSSRASQGLTTYQQNHQKFISNFQKLTKEFT